MILYDVNTFDNGKHLITKINIDEVWEIETTLNHKFLKIRVTRYSIELHFK